MREKGDKYRVPRVILRIDLFPLDTEPFLLVCGNVEGISDMIESPAQWTVSLQCGLFSRTVVLILDYFILNSDVFLGSHMKDELESVQWIIFCLSQETFFSLS